MAIIHVQAMQGIGDSVYQRPFIKILAQTDTVYLETPLPEIFSDIPNVRFVKPNVPWRTQAKQFGKTAIEFVDLPSHIDKRISPNYGPANLPFNTVMNCLSDEFNVQLPIRFDFDLPENLPPHGLTLPSDRPIAIIRPNSFRAEWKCTSRSPKAEYISWCSSQLKKSGFYVISIADIQDKQEWLETGPPPADMHLHKGELGIFGTMDLIRSANVVVSGSGWVVPTTVALKTPLFIIFGGRGLYDSPQKLLDWRFDVSRVGYSVPDNFCRCGNMQHSCDKNITNLDTDFFSFLTRMRQHEFL